MYSCVMMTPIGALEIVEKNSAVTSITYISKYQESTEPTTDLLKTVVSQLEEYFNGERKSFDFPIDLQVTGYYKKVLEQLMQVKYGDTVSYSKLAELTDNPKAARAVGTAMRKNPIVIVVPCHRVLKSDGTLGDYSAGGSCNKEWLLTFETQNSIMLL